MINKLINECIKENIQIEIYTTKQQSTTIEVFNNYLDKFETSNDINYNLKAIYNGKNVIISTSYLKNIKEIINTIKENANLIDNNDLNEFAKENIIDSFKIKKEYIDYKKIIEDLISLNYLKEKYPYLESISTSFGNYTIEESIINKDVKLSGNNMLNSYYFDILISNKDSKESGFHYEMNREYDFNKIKNLLEKKIVETYNKLQAQSVKTKKYNIILGRDASYKILRAFCSMFMAENINKKTSVLSNHYNKKVFSDLITIVEDPNNENKIQRKVFDYEGTRTYYKEIVKNGVFITKLYNNKEAIKDKTVSTGNASGIYNLTIKNGNKSFEELLTDLCNGIYIDEVTGLHAGLDINSGNISVQSSGYLVKDGKISRPIKMILLSTNLFELYNNVYEVGNDTIDKGLNGTSPSLLIKNITIAGSEK